MLVCASCGGGEDSPLAVASLPAAEEPEHPTFSRDIAPLVFANCSVCHRPGESAPFSLLSYEDVRKHAKQIAEVTASRFMPPWLPVEGYGKFVGERRLQEGEIGLFQRWHEDGAPGGDPAETPPVPEFIEGWQLGKPDLIVTMPEPYTLPADGRDVYRNFVLPVSVDRARYVRGVEFRPGNPQIVHHAFVLVDDHGGSMALDAADPGPGFEGMDTGPDARSPGGQFVSWQPGKRASFVPEGMSWRLPVGTRLVVQMHMRPSGKPEVVQARVGLFFTDEPPTRVPYKLVLASSTIDIPAGERNYVLDSSYRLPVDVKVYGLIPHAHYLAREMRAFADLPDGSRRWLLRIDRWDFNWQGDYRFKEPVALPKGSILRQHFVYDNSAENPLNPNLPPKRVRFGPNTTDEMGELWLQVLPATRADDELLNRDYGGFALRKRVEQLERQIAAAPGEARLRAEYGKVLMAVGREAEAGPQLDEAIRLDDPAAAEAYYLKGMIQVRAGQAENGRQAFEEAIARDPRHFAALNALGMLALRAQADAEALGYFQRAVDAYPEEASMQGNLGLVLLRLGRPTEALVPLRRAYEIEPENPKRAQMLREAEASAAK
jgi:tetratricopeptide (TPR) repeat protein